MDAMSLKALVTVAENAIAETGTPTLSCRQLLIEAMPYLRARAEQGTLDEWIVRDEQYCYGSVATVMRDVLTRLSEIGRTTLDPRARTSLMQARLALVAALDWANEREPAPRPVRTGQMLTVRAPSESDG